MKMPQELHLPALRCHIGDWVYYLTCLRLREAANRVTLAEALSESTALDDLLQRQLRKRTKEITSYLLTEPQRFMNSIVVAVYGGDPAWLELEVQPSELFALSSLDLDTQTRLHETLGFLRLAGDEKLFALDGQHRLVGIKAAIAQNEELGNEEIGALFVGHETTTTGKQRTRRLFTTLNRHAKPISIGERIALDEDDACAILTRRLVKSHPLLQNQRVAGITSNSIPPSDRSSLTTIRIVYEICQLMLLNRRVGASVWTKKKLDGRRPKKSDLDVLYKEVSRFWNRLARDVPAIREFQLRPIDEEPAAKYRNSTGGHVLFRPVGLHAFALAIRELMDAGYTIEKAVKALGSLKYELAAPFWKDVLWNREAGTMNALAKHRQLASQLILYQARLIADEGELLATYRERLGDPNRTLPRR